MAFVRSTSTKNKLLKAWPCTGHKCHIYIQIWQAKWLMWKSMRSPYVTINVLFHYNISKMYDMQQILKLPSICINFMVQKNGQGSKPWPPDHRRSISYPRGTCSNTWVIIDFYTRIGGLRGTYTGSQIDWCTGNEHHSPHGVTWLPAMPLVIMQLGGDWMDIFVSSIG